MGHSTDSGVHKWLEINDVPTCIQVWGGWTEEELPTDTVIVVVTGNPGITDFYVGFMKALQMECGGHPVWVIGQAGHMHHPKCPPLDERPELYNLMGQVKHKMEFIKTYVPRSKKIILVGHSIGGKICVELLKDESIENKVEQVHLMMPCLENIGTTRNGWWFQNLGVWIFPVFAALAKLLTIVPIGVQFFVLKILYMIRFRTTKFDENVLNGVIKLCHPSMIKQAVFLAKDEMMKVAALDDEVYQKCGSKMFAYYAQEDGWSPLTHYENLRKRHRKVTAVVLNKSLKHAFMVHHDADMAKELALNTPSVTTSGS